MRQTPLEDPWQACACSSSHDNANRGRFPCLRPSTRSDGTVLTYYLLANTEHSGDAKVHLEETQTTNATKTQEFVRAELLLGSV